MVSLLFAVALASSMLVIAGLTQFALKIGLVDRPGGHKHHDRPVPLLGGIAFYVAFLISIGLSVVFGLMSASLIWPLLASITILFAVGLADDLHPLPVMLRFVTQVIAVLIMVEYGGVSLEHLGGIVPGVSDIKLGWIALPFTIFATVAVINATNMMDGIDGLLGGLSFVSMLGLMLLLPSERGVYISVTVAFAGAIAGFLYFNLRRAGNPRARVFMGDAGSTVLGFLFAWILIANSQGEERAIQPVSALWILSIPLFDSLAAIVRRLWLRKSPVRPDNYHFHHLLLSAGYTVPGAVFFIIYLHAALIGLGLLAMTLAVPEWVQMLLFVAIFVAYLYCLARPWRFVPTLQRLRVILSGS